MRRLLESRHLCRVLVILSHIQRMFDFSLPFLFLSSFPSCCAFRLSSPSDRKDHDTCFFGSIIVTRVLVSILFYLLQMFRFILSESFLFLFCYSIPARLLLLCNDLAPPTSTPQSTQLCFCFPSWGLGLAWTVEDVSTPRPVHRF
jgi:hypothetical protein